MKSLTTRYRILDSLPRRLFVPIVTHLDGDLEERARAVVTLRSSLLAGTLPSASELPWPARELCEELLRGIDGAGLPRLCRNDPEFADEVLLAILDVVLSAELFIGSASAHFTGMALCEQAARRPVTIVLPGGLPSECSARGEVVRFDDATLKRIKEESRRLAVELARAKIRAGMEPWKDRAEAVRLLHDVLEGLAPRVRSGWTLERGMLRAVSLDDVTRLHELVAKLEQLRDLVQALGRLHASDDESGPRMLERISGPMRRSLPEEVKTPNPKEAHVEVRGCVRSGDVARMLPSEAVSLMHPTLRLAWHARRAENALLSYDAISPSNEIVHRTRETNTPGTIEVTRRERGPIIVCLDTSGSMQGAVGLLAKVVTLHAMLVAHDEGRRCLVYSFSGPGDVIEHEIHPTAEGIEAFLGFVLLDFQGGTDVSEPLRRALAKQAEDDWKEADILLVSDGYHDAPPEIVAAIDERRMQSSLRVHGLLIGSAYSAEMEMLCSPVHRVDHWMMKAAAAQS